MNFRSLLLSDLTALCVAGAGVLASSAAGAQAAQTIQKATGVTQPGTGIAEVVVTARKRSENLQRVPIAVTSTSGSQLTQKGIFQIHDLGRYVPSMTVTSSESNSTAVVFNIRGQTAGDIVLTESPAVGIYEDAANIPHPDGLGGALFDIGSVEVLRGPQGTLYGRNTTGGAVNITTKGADYEGYHGFLSGELGNDRDVKVGGAVNLPLIKDVLALRLAVQQWDRRGYGYSTYSHEYLGGDHDDTTARLSVRFDPVSNFSSSTKVEYTNLRRKGNFDTLLALPSGSPAPLEAGLETGCGSFANIPALYSCGLAALAPYVGTGNLYRNGQSPIGDHVQTWHAVEDMRWQINNDVALRSVTSFHHLSDFPTLDLDTTPFQILGVDVYAGGVQPIPPFGPYPHPAVPDQDYRYFTQEFDLSGKAFDNHLEWLVGAFGSWEHGYGSEPYIGFAYLTEGTVSNTATSDGENTDTWGIYTQEDYHFNDKLSITGGVRFSEEHQSNTSRQFSWTLGQYTCVPSEVPAGDNNPATCPSIYGNESASGVSYLASLNYQLNPDIMVYIKTSSGFRGGALQFRAPQLPPVKPETATDYEVGFKGAFLENHLQTNLAAYYTQYSNKQESIIETLDGHSTTVLFNAATAHIDGVEAEVTAIPIQGWSVYGTLTYLNGVYNSFPDAVTPEGVTFDASGLKFPDPTWHYSVGSRYAVDVGPGNLNVELDWTWNSAIHLTPLIDDVLFSTALQQQLTSSVGLLNGRLNYVFPDMGFTMSIFATNMLNRHYQTIGLFSGALGIGTGDTQEPRMIGISLTKTFGGG